MATGALGQGVFNIKLILISAAFKGVVLIGGGGMHIRMFSM